MAIIYECNDIRSRNSYQHNTMNRQITYFFTTDKIEIGEDGSTLHRLSDVIRINAHTSHIYFDVL